MKPKDVILGKPLNSQPPSQPHHVGNAYEGHPSSQKGYSPQMPRDFPTSVPFFKNPTASSFPSTVRTPSTPYPYYQRNPQDEYSYKRPTHFKKPSQSFTESPFQDHFDPIIKNKKPSSFFPEENSYSDFPSTGYHDDHIKNFPVDDFHLHNDLPGKYPGVGDDILTEGNIDLTEDLTHLPKRKKKYRGSKPSKSKTTNIFESYFNALRDGLKLPTLSTIQGEKKEKSKGSSYGGRRKRRRRKKESFWNGDGGFMGDFLGNSEDIFR